MRLLYILVLGSISVLIVYTLMYLVLRYYPFESTPLYKFTAPKEYKTVQIGSQPFELELATTTLAKAKGLGYRDSMPEDQGMLFFFDAPGKHGFWMKGMRFPLDIIWLRNDVIVFIAENLAPPTSPIPPSYAPTPDADAVIELTAGMVKKLDVHIGDVVKF